MSLDRLGDVNYLAVLVAAVAWWVLGAVWFARPVFGRAWQRAAGVQVPEDFRPGPGTLVVPLIAYFVGALATALIALASNTDTFGEGIILGLVVGIGYALVHEVVGATFQQKPQPGTFVVISGVYDILGLTIAAVIVTLWD